MSIRHWSRRDLLRALGTTAAAAPFRGIGTTILGGLSPLALAASAPEYRALVCINLAGGNDGYNMLVPSDSARYSAYQAARGNLALSLSSCTALQTASKEGTYSLHSSLSGLAPLYDSGRLGFLANVGTMVRPVTKSEYSNPANIPPALFSHYDQIEQAWSCQVQAQQRKGWAGGIADRISNLNANTDLSLNISLSGINMFQTGQMTSLYAVDQYGVKSQYALTSAGTPFASEYLALLDIAKNDEMFVQYHADMNQHSIDLATSVSEALAAVPVPATTYPSTDIARQLKMIANLVAARDSLSMSRQIFFVSLGSFDTHDGQLSQQGTLFSYLSQALVAFQSHLDELGMADSVVTFTTSDFGRTLTSNGDGSDHGWGNVQFVVGGAGVVKGAKVFGTFPDQTPGSADDLGAGRMIPTTSNDQYAATLARWIGIPDEDLVGMFPNLANFSKTTLGFLRDS